MEYVIYRYSATGMFGYAGYQGDKEHFTIHSIVVPNTDIHIHTEGAKYICPFGNPRTIRNAAGESIAQLQQEGTGLYSLCFQGKQYTIQHMQHSVCVTPPVFQMHPISEDTPSRVRDAYCGYDVKAIFRVSADPQLSDVLLAILSGIPLLSAD